MTGVAHLIQCPNCGATNRVAGEETGKVAVCGRCKMALPMGSAPIDVTDASFLSVVEKSPIPVLVDMWAPWCGPCRMIAPVLEELAGEMAGKVRVVKMNVDENPATSDRFEIRSIPALIVFKNGREVDRMVGVQPKTEIARRLAAFIA